MYPNTVFNQGCQLCPRLSAFLVDVKQQHPHYHCQPVAPFGDPNAALVIVGLAPGMHGANASGRPFTGDFAGILLYQTLYEFGYSNQAVAESVQDGLVLRNCRITNAVKCLPPQNKPLPAEINQCNRFLTDEFKQLKPPKVILALGTIAHQAVLKAHQFKPSQAAFGHHACHQLNPDLKLIDSYHTSRYNIQTKRLTQDMFRDVFQTITRLLQQ